MRIVKNTFIVVPSRSYRSALFYPSAGALFFSVHRRELLLLLQRLRGRPAADLSVFLLSGLPRPPFRTSSKLPVSFVPIRTATFSTRLRQAVCRDVAVGPAPPELVESGSQMR